MSRSKEQGCLSCKFFDPSDWERVNEGELNPIGICRVKPPVIAPRQELRWPTIHGDDWCGEYYMGPQPA